MFPLYSVKIFLQTRRKINHNSLSFCGIQPASTKVLFLYGNLQTGPLTNKPYHAVTTKNIIKNAVFFFDLN